MREAVAFEADAGKYSVPEALDRFVPNLVWDRVREPSNQVLYGGNGTGKTMLLKRLSWPAMLRQPAFLRDTSFTAFYSDMRELEDLNVLFSPGILQQVPTIRNAAFAFAHCLGSLHLMHCVASSLLETEGSAPPATHSLLVDALLKTARRALVPVSPEKLASSESLVKILEEMKADFIASIGSPPRLLRQAEVAALVTPPEQFFRLFCQAVHSRAPIRIGLLLDQYEMLPTEAQPIFNSLLKRENSTSFFTVIACRPFSLRTNLLNGTIQPSEDFSFTLVEYFPPDQDRYRKLLLEIWKRLHPQGKGIETILEDGIAYFADIQRERGDRRAQGQF